MKRWRHTVNPSRQHKLTRNKPAEEEGGRQGVPGGADPTERVGGLVFGLAGARQAGQQRQGQAKDPRHDQVDGDVGFSRTVMQIDRAFERTHGNHKEKALLRRRLLTDGDLSDGHDAEAGL